MNEVGEGKGIGVRGGSGVRGRGRGVGLANWVGTWGLRLRMGCWVKVEGKGRQGEDGSGADWNRELEAVG